MVAWQDLPWKKIQRHVFRLQKRMYRATQQGRVRIARKLQQLLVKSWYARLLAVRRITQDNRGHVMHRIMWRFDLQHPLSRDQLALCC
jgi:RNA-directed DNA polymerase